MVARAAIPSFCRPIKIELFLSKPKIEEPIIFSIIINNFPYIEKNKVNIANKDIKIAVMIINEVMSQLEEQKFLYSQSLIQPKLCIYIS